MVKRMSAFMSIGVIVIAMTGCPTVPENRASMEQLMVQPGNWVFVFYDRNHEPFRVAGIALNEDATTDRFVVEGDMVESTRGWWQTGDLFTLEQNLSGFTFFYQADVESANQLSGDVVNATRNIVEGSFYAARVSP